VEENENRLLKRRKDDRISSANEALEMIGTRSRKNLHLSREVRQKEKKKILDILLNKR